MPTSPARQFATAVASAFLCFLLVGSFVMQLRHLGIASGFLPVAHADASAVAMAAPVAYDGTVTAEYCSEVVAANDPANPSGRTSTQMTFDDRWLLRDSHVYQHDLATACAVLAAVCNSESQFYDRVEGSVPYAERTLGALGFEDVRTESYALRSSVLDELGALLTGSHDVAAYTLASKTVAGAQGNAPVTLIFVGIRGTYGAEWISNFNFLGQSADELDHRGFKAAEAEVAEALETYAQEIGADPDRTRILITGHSRGGAIANLLAADLDEASAHDGYLAPSSGVYAYTFAAPCATRADDRRDRTFGNIFNVVNEADIVPQLPLAAWGFGRYGTTMTLSGTAGADAPYALLQDEYRSNTGRALGCDEDTFDALCSWGEEASRRVTSADDLANPIGLVNAAQALLGIDVSAALAAHYPDTYIAWMQAGGIARPVA